jgi:hypothetical protein
LVETEHRRIENFRPEIIPTTFTVISGSFSPISVEQGIRISDEPPIRLFVSFALFNMAVHWQQIYLSLLI